MEFLSLKPEAFGLDISDLSLKIVKLKPWKKRTSILWPEKEKRFFELASIGEEKIKPGIVEAGEVKNEQKLAETIKEALKKVRGERLKTNYVIASLPEEKAFLQVIQMPRLPEEDLRSAVIYEAENYIPLPIEEVYLDYQIVPPVYNHLDHLDLLIAAIPKKIVDLHLSSLKLAGLFPLAFEIESQAIARALIQREISTCPLLLIDLGATRTSFIIFSGYSLRLTSSTLISSQTFNELIAKYLKVSLAEAERLKIKHGLGGKKEFEFKKKTKEGKIFEALVPALVDLVQQIRRHLDYYQTHTSHEHLPPNSKAVAKILLCGGGANLKGLPEFLSMELGLSVEMGNPWVNILPKEKMSSPSIPISESLKYTTALGLALRGARE